MILERTATKLLCSTPVGRGPTGRHTTGWRDYVEDLTWFCLSIPPATTAFTLRRRGSRCLEATRAAVSATPEG